MPADFNRLLLACGHRKRATILMYLRAEGGDTSAKEVHDAFFSRFESLPDVSYRVRFLARAGLLSPTREVKRRGALEHRYELVADRFTGLLVEVAEKTLEGGTV